MRGRDDLSRCPPARSRARPSTLEHLRVARRRPVPCLAAYVPPPSSSARSLFGSPRVWQAAVVALSAALGRDAGAEPSAEDEARARSLFASGALAYAAGRYDDAISLFQSGDSLAPRPAFSYNLAVAYEGKRESARALEHYRSYLRRGPRPEERATITTEIRRLERLLASRGVQQVTIRSVPVAELSLDGRTVGTSPWTGELSPGRHHVEVRPPGADSFRSSFELPADRAVDVRVARQEVPSQPLVRSFAWAFLGLSATAATMGTVLGFVALDRKRALDENCGRSCGPGFEADLTALQTTRNIAFVSIAFALAGAATTVVLFTRPDNVSPTIELSLVPPTDGRDGAYGSVRATF